MIIFDTKTSLASATRTGTPSYTSSNLNSWKGLTNDSWSSISNTSELQSYIGRYIFFEVLVSDTNKLARYIFKLNSISGTTIYCVNVGWGYEGSTEWSWSIGKIPSEYGDYKPIENIVYNGTSLTSLVYNGTQVWSKASWHTVWTGSITKTISSGQNMYTYSTSGVRKETQSRYTGDFQSLGFTGITPPYSKSLTRGTVVISSDKVQANEIIFTIGLSGQQTSTTMTLTKVEQYY